MKIEIDTDILDAIYDEIDVGHGRKAQRIIGDEMKKHGFELVEDEYGWFKQIKKTKVILFVDVHEAKPTKCYVLDTLAKPYKANPITTDIKQGITAEEIRSEVNQIKEKFNADKVIYNIGPGASNQIFRKVLLD